MENESKVIAELAGTISFQYHSNDTLFFIKNHAKEFDTILHWTKSSITKQKN